MHTIVILCRPYSGLLDASWVTMPLPGMSRLGQRDLDE